MLTYKFCVGDELICRNNYSRYPIFNNEKDSITYLFIKDKRYVIVSVELFDDEIMNYNIMTEKHITISIGISLIMNYIFDISRTIRRIKLKKLNKI